MRISVPLIASASIVAILATCGYLYLFRSIKIDNPTLGVMKYNYRWGRPYSLTGDTNRDGKVDAQAICWESGSFEHGYSEMFEDRNFDGIFELHYLLADGAITRIEIDDDADGQYDRTLEGAEARRYFESLPPPANARRKEVTTP